MGSQRGPPNSRPRHRLRGRRSSALDAARVAVAGCVLHRRFLANRRVGWKGSILCRLHQWWMEVCIAARRHDRLCEGVRHLGELSRRRLGVGHVAGCELGFRRGPGGWRQAWRHCSADRWHEYRSRGPISDQPGSCRTPSTRPYRKLGITDFRVALIRLRLFGNRTRQSQSCTATGALIMCSRGSN